VAKQTSQSTQLICSQAYYCHLVRAHHRRNQPCHAICPELVVPTPGVSLLTADKRNTAILCAGKLLLEACPGVASMTGAEVLTALGKGSEMRKAWEGGSGGSNRLVQCVVSQGQACIAYGHGWLRKPVQHPIDRSAVLFIPQSGHDAQLSSAMIADSLQLVWPGWGQRPMKRSLGVNRCCCCKARCMRAQSTLPHAIACEADVRLCHVSQQNQHAHACMTATTV